MTGIGQVFASAMPAKEDRTEGYSDNLKQYKNMEHRNLGGMLSAVQSEYAIWWREPETKIFPTLQELGIGFVPYCPLGRAFLTGTINENSSFQKGDRRWNLPQFLDEYIEYLTEVGEISLRTEPGVLTMYAVGEKENPCQITILETYASRKAYDKHIASAHFQKYKQGTLHMVKSLELKDQTPLNPANRINNFME